MEKPHIFISYARPDQEHAQRLYAGLHRHGLKLWRDKESLRAGSDWETSIKKAISESRYFIALLSSNSVMRRGFVQKELRAALDELDSFPESDVFIIPVRLDDTPIDHPRLKKLHYVDMFPNWEEGLAKILLTMQIEGSAQDSERGQLPRDSFYISSTWTEEGIEIKGGKLVIPGSEALALFKHWLNEIPRFIEQGKQTGQDEPLERAFILATLQACYKVYKVMPDEVEMKRGSSIVARKINLFYNFARDIYLKATSSDIDLREFLFHKSRKAHKIDSTQRRHKKF